MAGGNGSGSIEKDTLEIRAETLTIRAAGNAERTGDSDRLEIGNAAALDVVAGQESLDVEGLFRERIGGSASTQASHRKTTVKGRLKVSGRTENTLLGGAMADTQAGAVLVAAGMADDLVIGGGARATAPVDIWLAGVIGMEEKVGTAAADGVFMESYRTLFEREYGSGTHVAGTAVFSGALHVTVKAGFRPMLKVLRGIRNLTPGGGGGGGSGGGSAAPPTAAPPAAPSGAATGFLGTFRGVSGLEDAGDLPRLSDSLARTEDLANATETARARDAGTASRLEDLQSLRRAAEQDDTQEAAAILRRLPGGDRGAPQRPANFDFSARYYLSMDADGRHMLIEDPEGPYRFAEAPDGSCQVVQDPEAEFTASEDLRGYDIEMGPDGRYRLVDPSESDSDVAYWRNSFDSDDASRRFDDPADPGHARPFADDGLGDSRAGNPGGARRPDRRTGPGHARTFDLRPEPAPPGGPGGDSRSGPIAAIETVDQRSYVVPPEGGDLTRNPVGPSPGADEANQGPVYVTVIQDPTANQGVATPRMEPVDDSSRGLLDIDIEQIDLEGVDDARDLPSPGRLSDSTGEGASPGMQLGDRGPRWEQPDLPPARADAPDDKPAADILRRLPEDGLNQPSEPPSVSHFYGDDGAAAAPPPVSTPSGQEAGRALPPNVDTTGAIQRLRQEISLQTEEIRRVRDGGGAADDLRRLEAERDARRLALSELQAGRDPRRALRAQAAGAEEAYRAEAFADLVDYFGGAGQFTPQGSSPGAFGGRVPSWLDTSTLIEDWRQGVGAFSESVDALNPRTRAEIERAESLADTESWMRQAIILVANRQDPCDELLRHAADLEARTLADGTTGAGEASMLRAMAKEYRNLVEEFLGSFPAFPQQQLDETLPAPPPSSLDLDAGSGVPVENTGIPSTGEPGAGPVEPPPLDADRGAAPKSARQNLGDDIYDAFGASAPGRDTPAADPGSDLKRNLIQKDYWGMLRDVSPPAPSSSNAVADTATDPVRVPTRGEHGKPTSDAQHILDGMEAAFDDNTRTPSPGSDRYRLSTETVNRATDVRISTDDQAADATRLLGIEDFEESFGISENSEGATAAPTARQKGGKVR